MVDPKLGSKRVCEACSTKYYDLNKSPAICPNCGQEFNPEAGSTPSEPVRAVEPTVEKNEKDEAGEHEKDDATVSLEDMVDEETDDGDEDEKTLEEFEADEALLDDNDEDDTLLEDEEEEESFLENNDEDDG